MNAPTRNALRRALEALGPYRDQLVLVGAQAHRLFSYHPLASPATHEPLGTQDLDIATPLELPVAGPSLAERLRAAHCEELMTGHGPVPFIEYKLKDELGEFLVEFVAPRPVRTRKQPNPPDIVKVSGTTATTFRSVELLLVEPWSTEIEGMRVRVANPAAYVGQKLLELPRRLPRGKRAKDVLYIHDTMELFGARGAEMRESARSVLACASAPKDNERLLASVKAISNEQNGLVIEAAIIAATTGRPNPPSPARLATVCRVGLNAIFGV